MMSDDGNETDTTMVRFPPPDSDQPDATVVDDDDTIDPDSTYVVAAQCHQPKLVTGEELLRNDGTELEHNNRRSWIEPCSGREDALDKVARALRAEGVDFNPSTSDYTIEQRGPGCEVFVRPQPAAATVAPGCTAGVPPATQTADGTPPPTGVPPATDDPGVDPSTVVPVSPDEPVTETNQTSEIAQPELPSADDPLFTSLGSWGQTYPDQWGLHRIGFRPGADAGTPLWPGEAEPVVVAIIDTGLDILHPELSGAVWINEDEIHGNGVDDDANGYIDDLYGWNFVSGNDDITDLNGHGTVIAGIIASWTGNDKGIAGVNPWARIMPLKVANWTGDAWNFDIADAIR